MNADTITPGKVADLAVVLETALSTTMRVHREIQTGDITPEDAAEILNEAIASVQSFGH